MFWPKSVWVLLSSTPLPSAPSKRSVVNLSPFCFHLCHWRCNTGVASFAHHSPCCFQVQSHSKGAMKHAGYTLLKLWLSTASGRTRNQDRLPREVRELARSYCCSPGQKQVPQQVLTSAKPGDLGLRWTFVSGISVAFCFLHLSYDPVNSSPFSLPFFSKEIKICLLCSIIFIAHRA